MCGRYYIDFDDEQTEEIETILKNIQTDSQAASLSALRNKEIFPTNQVPIIARTGQGQSNIQIKDLIWGFPQWKGGGVIINARAETAGEKKTFKVPLLNNRCVILSSGFYEWKAVEGQKKKEKYQFNIPGQQLLFMAGMASTYQTREGIPYEAFVILTTAANSSMQPFHNRMPVILDSKEIASWINDGRSIPYILNKTEPLLSHQKIE